MSTIDFDTDNLANIKGQRHVVIIYMYISMRSRVHINTYCVHKHDIDIESIYDCKQRQHSSSASLFVHTSIHDLNGGLAVKFQRTNNVSAKILQNQFF